MLAMCPNCENYMCVATKCTNCGHKDRDRSCSCSYCQRVRQETDGDRDNETP